MDTEDKIEVLKIVHSYLEGNISINSLDLKGITAPVIEELNAILVAKGLPIFPISDNPAQIKAI